MTYLRPLIFGLVCMGACTGILSTFAADMVLGTGGTLAPQGGGGATPLQPLVVSGTSDHQHGPLGFTTLDGGVIVSCPGQVKAGEGGWGVAAHGHPDAPKTRPQNPPVIPPLAPAAVAPKLDTNLFDAVAKALNLNAQQGMQLGSLKQRIKDEGERLTREHERARKAYANSQTQEAFEAAQKDVAATDRAIVDFDPQARFSRGLFLVLTGEQYGFYWDEVTKNMRIALKK